MSAGAEAEEEKEEREGAPATVSVPGSGGQIYKVDVVEKTCTCLHFAHRGGVCKHIESVTRSAEGQHAIARHQAASVADEAFECGI